MEKIVFFRVSDSFRVDGELVDSALFDKYNDDSSYSLQVSGMPNGSIAYVFTKEQRGGFRPGAGRKPMKPTLKKQTKSFTLSPETVQALKDLQESLGLPSQSAVVEYLVLKANIEFKPRVVKEIQREIF